MTKFKRFNRWAGFVAPLAAGIVLLAATEGVLAKDGGHSNDHGGMKSGDSSRNSGDHKNSGSNPDHGDKYSQKHKDKDQDKYSDKHEGKGKEHAAKTKDKDKDKSTGTTTTATGNTPAPGSDKDLFGKGVVGRTPTDIKPIPSPAAPGAVPGPAAVNTIHPIPSPPRRVVTISNGKDSFQIYDGPGGVTVTSSRPGQLTVSNGVQTQTLSGIAMTITGSAGVGVAKGLGTGPRQADGSVVVLSPNGTVTGGGLPGGGWEAYDPPR
jgi:hypothetical protein